jgi:hypothetical protein
MAASGSLKTWLVALLASANLVIGAELFLRYSTHQSLKALSLALTAAGILVLGGLLWSGYLVGATRRYPGLLKEPQPYPVPQQLALGGKVLVAAVAATLAVGAARWLVAAAVARRSRNGPQTNSHL